MEETPKAITVVKQDDGAEMVCRKRYQSQELLLSSAETLRKVCCISAVNHAVSSHHLLCHPKVNLFWAFGEQNLSTNDTSNSFLIHCSNLLQMKRIVTTVRILIGASKKE